MNAPRKAAGESGESQDWLEIVRAHVNSLRFGAVEIVVHESRVVQIQRTERVRLNKQQLDPKSEQTG